MGVKAEGEKPQQGAVQGGHDSSPWGKGRRFYSYTQYLTERFGGRVQKLTLDAGCGCPHREGRGEGGCIYCNNSAFTPSYCHPAKGITRQLQEGVEFHRGRYRRSVGYLAYFQSYTNTYGGVARLRELYHEALAFPGVKGLALGTRPDCLGNDVLALLRELSERAPLFLELGVESMHDSTLRAINRGHDHLATEEALSRLRGLPGVSVGVHMIVGLPGEDEGMVTQSVERVCQLGVDSIKFHQLQVIQGTRLAQMYAANPSVCHPLERGDYLELMVRLLERVPATVAIERICAEVPPRYLIAPSWGTLRYDAVLREFEQLQQARDSWQGKRASKGCKSTV